MKRKRFYIPGDTWLYYKIYLVPFRSDWFLKEIMFPLLQSFQEEAFIGTWYFIRYSDPEYHLRIRIRLNSLDYLADIMKSTREKVQPLIRHGRIKNVQLDTYQREYERYGNNTIAWCEEIFYHDSNTVMEMMNHTLDEGEDQDEIRFLSAIKSTEQYMKDFKMNQNIRKEFLHQIIEGISDSFQDYDFLVEKISKKFRCQRKMIERTMTSWSDNQKINLFEKRSVDCRNALKSILEKHDNNKLDVPLVNLAASVIHLSLNRIFPSYHLINEVATYIYLFRYYKSKIAREKYDERKKIILNHEVHKGKHKGARREPE